MNELNFRQGYYLAVSVMVRQHGADIAAEECLREYGPLNFRGIEPIDREVLKPLAKEIRRKKRIYQTTNPSEGK